MRGCAGRERVRAGVGGGAVSERALVDLTVPGSAAWVCLVRRWVADALTVAGHRDVDGVRLVVSELAGNAALHTGSGRPGGLVRVKVYEVADALARVEVIDEGAATVPRSRRSGDEECGVVVCGWLSRSRSGGGPGLCRSGGAWSGSRFPRWACSRRLSSRTRKRFSRDS
ncbi:ATP-binding protein [Nonomuraea glycinis]|uniref:ATP-binding protein n=1 Tax=Nonomuraea glycinis TaxID=2047744 RepID=UPI0033AABC6A